MIEHLDHFIESYPGSSFPTRVRTQLGNFYVVKLRGSGNGAAAQVSEFVVNRLASSVGLPVPAVSLVGIADDRAWDYGTDEFYDLVQKSGGANLAIEPLDRPTTIDRSQLAALPDEFVSQVVTIDLLFANLDRTHRSGNLVVDHSGRPWMLDHGTCRFAYRDAVPVRPVLPADHVFAGREMLFDPTWVGKVSEESLVEATLAELPDVWLAEISLSRNQLRDRLSGYFQAVRSD